MKKSNERSPENKGTLEDFSFGQILLNRLSNPRTWLYPILVAAIALFLLPRLAPQHQTEQKTPAPTDISSGPNSDDGTAERSF